MTVGGEAGVGVGEGARARGGCGRMNTCVASFTSLSSSSVGAIDTPYHIPKGEARGGGGRGCGDLHMRREGMGGRDKDSQMPFSCYVLPLPPFPHRPNPNG